MTYAKLWASCTCLLLLKLDMGAARAAYSGPSESLYVLARDLGLDAAGLDEIWRTGKPLVIIKQMSPNDVTTVTYNLGPDRLTITKGVENKFHSPFPSRERLPNERIPNQRNPNAKPPNERPAYTPNVDESNSNDPQWVPVPEATTRLPVVHLTTLAPSNNPRVDTVIDDFLAKVDVTTSDIKEGDGEYVRAIVDKNGRVLKAKFELIETKSQDGNQPTK